MPSFPIYSTSAIRKLKERAAPASGTLMERAGLAAAEFSRSLCGDTAKSILVVAGPGNNGGDAFEVAAQLKRWFFRVSVVFSGGRAREAGRETQRARRGGPFSRRSERHQRRHGGGDGKRGTRESHALLHRTQARTADPGRPGSLRRAETGDARTRSCRTARARGDAPRCGHSGPRD